MNKLLFSITLLFGVSVMALTEKEKTSWLEPVSDADYAEATGFPKASSSGN